jgi:hypothetical protein
MGDSQRRLLNKIIMPLLFILKDIIRFLSQLWPELYVTRNVTLPSEYQLYVSNLSTHISTQTLQMHTDETYLKLYGKQTKGRRKSSAYDIRR